MLTGVVIFAVVVACAVADYPHDDWYRFRRASGSSGSSSGSYSSSGSSAGSGGGVNFPSGGGEYYAFHNPMFGGGGAYPPFDFNAIFQQYLASLAAAQAYAGANPQYAPIFKQQLAALAVQQQAAMAQYPFAFPGPESNAIVPDGYGSANSPVFTSASASLGPQGGYGQASASPGGPDGLGLRIGQEFPAPSGGSFGTFSSSSSGSSDVNGKRTSYKTSTFGTNDNGKITFRTVSE